MTNVDRKLLCFIGIIWALYRDYMRRMEKKMETTIILRGCGMRSALSICDTPLLGLHRGAKQHGIGP